MAQVVHAFRLREVVLVVSALGCFGPASANAAAIESAGCRAANRGSLNVTASAGQNVARSAALMTGETLTLTIDTRTRAKLAVEETGGTRRTLLAGPASTARFVASQTGTYQFSLEAEGGATATLSAKCVSTARADAERALIARRKAFLAERDPDRIRIDRPAGQGKFFDSISPAEDGAPPREVTASISLSEITAAMNHGGKKDPSILDFWFEGRHLAINSDDPDTTDGSFAVMYFGSKYMLGPDIMLGGLAQFDRAGQTPTSVNGQVTAKGWMAGPYVSVKFGPGVVFDGRAAWGVAESGAPSGVLLDTSAPADRRLVRGTLRGNKQVNGWTFAPSVGLSYVEDTPSFAAAETAGSGRLDVLPEVKRRFNLDGSTYIEPRIAAGSFLAFDDIAAVAPRAALSAPDLQWKAEAGVAVGVKDSLNLQATGGVETGGQTAPDNWSGRLQLNMPLGN